MSSKTVDPDDDFKVFYEIDFSDFGRDHVINVQATFDVAGKSSLEIFIPVWTPGSYLVREYARHLESIFAKGKSDSLACTIEKVRKNAWRIDWQGVKDKVTVCYRLYAREKSVRTNWIERSYAFIVGSGTFLTTKDAIHDKHCVRLSSIPDSFSVDCSLSKVANEGVHDKNVVSLVAKDFDELIDSPILVGDLVVNEFEVDDKPHRLVSVGNLRMWNHEIAAQHTQAIVKAVQDFWGEVPYADYSFQNLVIGGFGGLEHDNCCVLLSDPNAMLNRSNYVDWLGLVSHEFFHTWNVRRLRPKALQNYDYENEQYLRELWIAEGITSYFDDLLVLRANLCSESELLTRLSKTVNTVMIAPGRNVQSLEDSSFDTWIKHYRPDENANNSRISYYTKGACVAWLLDVHLAKTSGFATRLDDVMRQLWKRYRSTGYTNQDFENLVAALVPYDWKDWFDQQVRGVEDLDFSPTLDFLGLRMKADFDFDKRSATEIAASVPESSSQLSIEVATMGCELRDVGGRIIVDRITRGGPASIGDLLVDDEIVAVNDVRVTFASIHKVIQYYRSGQDIKLTLVRRELIRTIEFVLGQPVREWKLEASNEAGDIAIQNRRRWLLGE